MKHINKLALGLISVLGCQAETRIIITAALTDAHAEFRKNQYIESFNYLYSYGYTKDDLYVVEALKKQGPTFLDDYSSHVFYATTNNPSYINNGFNEAATMLEALEHFGFDDEDMIIKLTGRHQLISDAFLKLVEQHQDEYDTFVLVNEDKNVFTVAYAMKYKYIKEMFGRLNFDEMAYTLRPIEYDAGDYLKFKASQGNFRIYYVDKLNVKAELWGSTTANITEKQVVYL